MNKDSHSPKTQHPATGPSKAGQDDRLLLRAVTHQLEPAEQDRLDRRLESDAELRRRFAELRETWSGLDSPTPAIPGGSVEREVMARLRSETGRASYGRRWTGPGWVSLRAAATMALGLAAGLLLGPAPGDGIHDHPNADLAHQSPSATALDPGVEDEASPWFDGPSLAEAYWRVLEESGGRLADGEAPTAGPGLEGGAGARGHDRPRIDPGNGTAPRPRGDRS